MMALDDQALATIARTRAWLTRGRTAESSGRLGDEPLSDLINSASAAIASHCQRQLLAPTSPETYRLDGNGLQHLLLPEWPVTELVSLSIDGQPIARRLCREDDGYVVRPREGLLSLRGVRFWAGDGNIELVGRLGFNREANWSDPWGQRAIADLRLACLLLCGYWFNQRVLAAAPDDPAEHEPGAGGRLPAEVEALLLPYRRVGV